MSVVATSVFVGVHRSGGPFGDAITAVTRLSDMSPPWTFGPNQPATHAFVVVSHGEGAAYRLDAQGDPLSFNAGALWTPWKPPTYPTKLWKVPFSSTGACKAKAYALTGWKYDWTEIGAQGAVVFERLPFLRRLALQVAQAPWIRQACVCTRLADDVLRAGDFKPNLEDLLPERISRWLGKLPTVFVESANP